MRAGVSEGKGLEQTYDSQVAPAHSHDRDRWHVRQPGPPNEGKGGKNHACNATTKQQQSSLPYARAAYSKKE